ncbi:hypothetical protein KKG52_01645, partial [Patescibacteria group bacterium]|nr:hypothetical protein [Patescibacteria group bacterium]
FEALNSMREKMSENPELLDFYKYCVTRLGNAISLALESLDSDMRDGSAKTDGHAVEKLTILREVKKRLCTI